MPIPRFSSRSVLVFFVIKIEKTNSPDAILVNNSPRELSLTVHLSQ
jgi:hypothetical protein